MKIKVKLDINAKMPTKAYTTDAGLDIYNRETEDVMILSHSGKSFDTGVHVEIPAGYVGFLKSKSGLNVKHNIQSDGVIDAGYTGTLVVKLYNRGDIPYTIHPGDKISQLVILPIPSIEVEEVKSLESSARGDNGFGSSGR